MEKKTISIFCSIIAFNWLFVYFGFKAVSKLKELEVYPFIKETEGFYHFYTTFPLLFPRWFIIAWGNPLSEILIVVTCLAVPIIALYLFSKDSIIYGWGIVLFWTLFSGFIGCWMYLYTIFNSPVPLINR